MKYKIIKDDGVDQEMIKEFEEQTDQKAKEVAAKYLTGDGLPCSGSPEDTYNLVNAEKNMVLFKFTAKQIWQAHMVVEGIKSQKKK